jgi:translation initiation factor IF-2
MSLLPPLTSQSFKSFNLLLISPPIALQATVLDACLDKGMGVVADVLVQWGQLNVGDAVVIGTSFGRVKSMKDHLVHLLHCLTALI